MGCKRMHTLTGWWSGLNQRQRTILIFLSSLLFSFLYMLPRLISPQFGLFDDGFNLSKVQEMPAPGWDAWELARGRFRPGYWYFWFFLYRLGGKTPLVFFLGNTVLLAGCLFLYSLFLSRLTRRWRVALLAVLILSSSPPLLETFYTLGKGEGLQIFWILAALNLAHVDPPESQRRVVDVSLLLSALALFIACLSKETSIVVLPFAAFVAFVDIFAARGEKPLYLGKTSRRLLLSALIAIPLYLVLRSSLVSTGSAGPIRYALEISSLGTSLVRWGGYLLSDFPYLLLLPLAFLVSRDRVTKAARGWLLFSVVWMLGWIAVFLPWTGMTIYFQLPLTLGLALMTSVLLLALVDKIRLRRHRGLSLFTLLCIVLLVILSLGNTLTDARIQLSTDRVNEEMLIWLSEHAPVDSLVVVNIQDPNEYYDEIGLHLEEFYGRGDLRLDFVRVDAFPPRTEESLYVLSPYATGIPVVTVRTGVVEPSIGSWNRQLLDLLPPEPPVVFEVGTELRLYSFKLPQLVCRWIEAETYCYGDPRTLDVLNYTYGWKIYRLQYVEDS